MMFMQYDMYIKRINFKRISESVVTGVTFDVLVSNRLSEKVLGSQYIKQRIVRK